MGNYTVKPTGNLLLHWRKEKSILRVITFDTKDVGALVTIVACPYSALKKAESLDGRGYTGAASGVHHAEGGADGHGMPAAGAAAGVLDRRRGTGCGAEACLLSQGVNRGDKTPLELFLAGVDVLDVTIRAMLCEAATD
jgi:hypothetical protein